MKSLFRILTLSGLFLLFSSLELCAQITTKYTQSFEQSGEAYGYSTVSGTVATVTTADAPSGTQVLKMSHTSTDAVVILDTVDFTDNSSYSYFTLSFMHVNNVNPLECRLASEVGLVEVRLADETDNDWVLLTSSYYDRSWGGGSSDYAGTGSFSSRSYNVWSTTGALSTGWKGERFNLNNVFQGIGLTRRQLLVRFTLKARTANGTTDNGWYIDGISIKASPMSMVTPVLSMVSYPDLIDYPTSRGTRIDGKATTTVQQGLLADSMYIMYRYGNTGDVRRIPFAPIPGRADMYRGYIPFCGYDTMVYYRVVVKDATTNFNTVTYPFADGAWERYRNVRAMASDAEVLSVGGASSTFVNEFPFPDDPESRTQLIYDSASLRAAGYGPGAMTAISFIPTNYSYTYQQNRGRLQIKMRNVETSFQAGTHFYGDSMKVVLDTTPWWPSAPANTLYTIRLQDTFFYAGHDLLIWFSAHEDSPNGNGAMAVNSYTTTASKQSLYVHYPGGYGLSPWDPSAASFYDASATPNEERKRPIFRFGSHANLPLLHDCGVSGFITPNDSVSANALSTNIVTVTLKNYGAQPITNVRLWYNIDTMPARYYDWSGNLAAGATTNVTLYGSQTYTPGYHEITAWVDDTVTSGGQHYRDHEPLNDTLKTHFIACAGAFNGQRQVGGSNADYATLENMLYALRECGVNGSLTVKLAPGTYKPCEFPIIPGLSTANYIQFEPLNGRQGSVRFVVNGNVNSIVDIQKVTNIRFKNITFVHPADSNYSITYFINMNRRCEDIRFDGCRFIDSASTACTALINSAGADKVRVSECYFYRGYTGLHLVGPSSDNLAVNNYVFGCTFADQINRAIYVRNQYNVVIDSNMLNDVQTNNSYLLLLQDCSGQSLRVTRNRMYSTNGAGCLGITGITGMMSNSAVVANNMIVCNDNGNSTLLTTPFNIISAQYVKFVYNSVKLTAPRRNGVAATSFGGAQVNHCDFYNNIVTCYDNSNYALNYTPNNTSGASNNIGYNIYYSTSPTMNRYSGTGCATLADWHSLFSGDPTSLSGDPHFLGGTTTDLRSYNDIVKNNGIPVNEVTNDIFGTQRAATPCIGAFEFVALSYDFEVQRLVEPLSDYCNVPASVPLRFVVRNSGSQNFVPGTSGTLTVYYSRNQRGTLSPTNSGSINIQRTIPAGDTIIVTAPSPVSFPVNGTTDSTYIFYFWTVSSLDPNDANDTVGFPVTAHYHASAPTAVSQNVTYGNSATLNITGGINTWYPHIFTSGRRSPSTVYWYTSPTSNTPFYRGNTYTTPVLYDDTVFYIKQKRDMAMIKIAEVQVNRTAAGATSPMPTWMNTNTKFAVELINAGDYPADLAGDTLQLVGAVAQITVLPHLVIQPGQSVVVQYRQGITTPDSLITFTSGVTKEPAYSANFGVIYRDGHGVADAVAFNNGHTSVTSSGTPASVWQGNGVSMTTATAGAYRKSWPANPSATPSNTAQYWQVADASHLMTMGTSNSNLVYYTDNGCEGEVSTVRLTVTNRPTVDLTVDSLVLPSGCGLGSETISANVNNFGQQTSGAYRVRFSVNGTQVGNENVSTGIPAGATVRHTFTTPANLSANSNDVNYTVKVWVDHLSNDGNTVNDTATATTTSSYTPVRPNVASPQSVNYGQSLTLRPSGTIRDTIVWYNSNMQVLDTAISYNTGHLYADDTFYVGAIAATEYPAQVGTATTVAGVTDNSSPFYVKQKYGRGQYLYSAADIQAAGHSAGYIKSLSFYIETVNVGGSITFTNYTVSLASVPSVISTFTSNAWSTYSTTDYYQSTSLTLSASDAGTWKRLEFPQPFYWDGTSNILVQVCRSLAAANNTSNQGITTRYTQNTATNNTVAVAVHGTNDPCAAGTTVNPGRQHKLPNIRFGFTDYGCVGPTKQVVVNVTGTPQVDGELAWPDGSDTATYTSCGNTQIAVKLTNNGTNPVTSYDINYYIDGVQQNTVSNSSVNITSRQSLAVNLTSTRFTPGRHTIKAILSIPGDGMRTNDTVERTINVRFCRGSYTIGASGDYANFTTAIDTLNNAGVAGAIFFVVQPGTYTEQIQLGPVSGMSAANTVTFTSASNDSTAVVLQYAPTATTPNYVMHLDGAAHYIFRGITFYSRCAATAVANMYSDVIHIENSNDITFRNNLIKVRSNMFFQNANNTQQLNACGMVIGDAVTNLTIENNTFDSAYYAIRGVQLVAGNTHDITINGNQIINFWNTAIQLRKVSGVTITANTITAGMAVNGKPLHGIYLAEHTGRFDIIENHISLVDNFSGGKRAIYLADCQGTANQRSRIYNNMASVSGTGVQSLVSSAIWIDSSTYINVYFNSTYLYAGANANTTRSFNVSTTSSNVQVINNIFSNFSCGYSYYVQQAANVSTSNYNNYYSSAPPQGAGKYAFWGADQANLNALRTANGQDANSHDIRPYFINEYDLHLAVGSFVELGQYNGEVQYDIDGNIRPQIPGPTIGAHEFARSTHDLSFLEVREPYMPTNINNPIHIESDSVRVIVMIYNNGTSVENNVPWYAEVVGCASCRSATRTISQISASSSIIDTVMIPTILGVMDTQLVRLHMQMDTQDITFDTLIYLAPAYNLRGMSTSITGGCYLTAAPVQITVRNEGKKTLAAGTSISIGYAVNLVTTGVTVPNIPLTQVDQYTLTNSIPPNGSETIIFPTPANIYPQGLDQNIVVRARSWVSYVHDLHEENDTTNLTGNINSYYTPQAPVVNDITIPYGTWDTVCATQANNLSIMWFRDSTQTPYFTNSNVARSWCWLTPQMFHDSTYYLASRTAQSCTSHFSPVTVHVVASVDYDAAVDAVVAPTDRVYMYDDTVKVSIINFGRQAFSNIPVTYQLRRVGNNTPLQTVTEVCNATVQPGSSHIFTFDSLIQIPQIGANYSIKAWTSLPSEMTPMNDTMMVDYIFTALQQTAYCAPTITNAEGLDITRVSYGTLDNSIRAAGYKYVNFGDINALDPGVPPIVVSRGFSDTLTVECEDSENSANDTSMGYLTVYADYNRDGQFDQSELVTQTRMTALHPYHYIYTIPQNASFGYMRLRLILQEGGSSANNGCATFSYGHVQDYLLYVEGDPKPLDLAIGRIVAPRSAIFTTDTHSVSFMLVNNGSQPVTDATIYYKYVDGSPSLSDFGQMQWQGNLMPGRSTLVTLDPHAFSPGTTDLCIYLDDSTDFNRTNDSTWYQYHRFETVTLILNDNFEGYNRWYAPRGYNRYTENYWQRGVPTKSNINTVVSDSSAWVTILNTQVTPGTRGNISILYSPVIDISQIRPDTISFYLRRAMSANTTLTLEYRNYTGNWETLGSSQDTMWYNTNDGFSGNQSGRGYTMYKLSTNDYTFPAQMQVRFVFRAPIGASACDGAAIDNFKISRARRAVDVGITNITQPVRPQLGQVINPKVAIHNYGYDTLHSVTLGYNHYGANLPKYGTWTGTIAPDATVLYTFTTPFTVTSEFPDTFTICAFTKMSADWYYDNDSCCKDFTMAPLEDDMSLVSFLSPSDNVVGGDSITVTVRLRNFGQNTVSSTPVSYVFNGGRTVTETIDFNAVLGRPLSSMEYYNYTFRTRARSSMGQMSIVAWSSMSADTYAHNDTISKRISGIGSIIDLRAQEIVLSSNKVQLVIANVGARAANSFQVGYWYDNDPSTAVVETYYRAEPLPALTNGYHIFSGNVPLGTTEITAFVHIDNDNEPNNDTTTTIASPYVDIRAVKVQVEENRGDDCRTRIVLENVGNYICTRTINLSAIVNGVTLYSTTTVGSVTRQIEPGRLYNIELSGFVPKSATRTYVGTGSVNVSNDNNSANNQTNVVEAINYFDDIPLVPEADGLILEQNYPNPYAGTTRIDFSIPSASQVRFFVIDAAGRMVYQEVRQYAQGSHSIDFSDKAMPAGIYYYGIECDGQRLMRKMILAK